MHEQDVRPIIPNVFPKIEKLVDYLVFDKSTTLDRNKTALLILLSKVSTKELDHNQFITRCKAFDTKEDMGFFRGEGHELRRSGR